jgi:16S rRNA (cytidine1402-2'-O)-methyltransferase
MKPGTLLVVATPLGNLQDLSPRGIEALRRARIVACEDTRRTRPLLTHFGIRPESVVSCHRFNEAARRDPILGALRGGADVALVSDGGTPGVSDPGALLVEAALREGIPVSPIPGPSAVAAAISACGFEAAAFVFAGFLPSRSGQRRAALEAMARDPRPHVFFEAPHRAAASLADMTSVFGDRQVTLLRETTKLHEEVRRTTLSRLAAEFSAAAPRGEITLVVEGTTAPDAPAPSDPAALRRRYAELIASGSDPRSALARLMKETGLRRRDLYAVVRSRS